MLWMQLNGICRQTAERSCMPEQSRKQRSQKRLACTALSMCLFETFGAVFHNVQLVAHSAVFYHMLLKF